MKGMKKKLAAAAAMLVVSAVMLSGVSYAWYTLSTNPEVTEIRTNLAANENLEIALDNGYANEGAVDTASYYAGTAQGSKTGNPYTWGNLVDLDKAMDTMNPDSGAIATPKLILSPVKYDATATNKFKYPQYGLDGRVSGLENLVTGAWVSDHDDVATPNGGVQGLRQNNTATVYDAFSVTYWLRSNETCTVSLSADGVKRANSNNDSGATPADVNGFVGGGSYIEIPVSGENTVDRVKAYAKKSCCTVECGWRCDSDLCCFR